MIKYSICWTELAYGKITGTDHSSNLSSWTWVSNTWVFQNWLQSPRTGLLFEIRWFKKKKIRPTLEKCNCQRNKSWVLLQKVAIWYLRDSSPSFSFLCSLRRLKPSILTHKKNIPATSRGNSLGELIFKLFLAALFVRKMTSRTLSWKREVFCCDSLSSARVCIHSAAFILTEAFNKFKFCLQACDVLHQSHWAFLLVFLKVLT